MSEYQYYEFLAVDRPLNDKQIDTVRRYSTRAEITSTRFVNEYHWGDFRGDVRDFLRRFFDVFVYVANWGTRRFAFRAPADSIDPKSVRPYQSDTGLEVHVAGEHVFFDICSETEDDEDWDDGGGWMASLAPLREEVLCGDLRPFYLAWLAAIPANDVDEDDLEPPVPAGLGDLSVAQRALVDFIKIDEDLLAVAAQTSPAATAKEDGLADWIAGLPEAEKNDLLTQLCHGRNPQIGAILRRRFHASAAASMKQEAGHARRRVSELIRATEVLAETRRQKEAREREEKRAREEAKAAKARSAYLADLAKRQPAVWSKVETLIASKQPRKYDEAVSLLQDLREVAARSGNEAAFKAALVELRSRHAKKPSFVKKMAVAELNIG